MFSPLIDLSAIFIFSRVSTISIVYTRCNETGNNFELELSVERYLMEVECENNRIIGTI